MGLLFCLVFSQNIMMPDFSRATNILTLNNDSLGVGTHTLFTAPENGYIRVVDCWTKVGYYLSLNKKITADTPSARIQSIYHKCASTGGQSGMFPINKGDVLYMFKATNFDPITKDGITSIIFYPGIVLYNF